MIWLRTLLETRLVPGWLPALWTHLRSVSTIDHGKICEIIIFRSLLKNSKAINNFKGSWENLALLVGWNLSFIQIELVDLSISLSQTVEFQNKVKNFDNSY